MANWQHLYFFDKEGDNYNMNYDSTTDMWTGDIFLPQVSIDLFEVGQLFILQKMIDSTNTSVPSNPTFKFGYPHNYIDGTTSGPVNGEQYFVEDSVNERLKLKVLPCEWFTRWVTGEDIISGKSIKKWQVQITRKYSKLTSNDYVFLGGEFHPDIKFVHFSHRFNKPHEWEGFKDYA